MKKVKTTLFTRLFIYFFILISIPIISFSIVSSTIAKRKVIDGLKLNITTLTKMQETKLENLFEEYRHKAYSLSKNEKIINLLKNPNLSTDSKYISEINNVLFQTMKGDTYNAAAIVTSIDGNIRLSTHPFPEEYDLRNHFTILEMASPLMDSTPFKYTKIISNTNLNSNSNVSLIMLRYVFDENDKAIGFILIDIYKQRVKEIEETNTLATSLLVDSSSYKAALIDNASEFYSFQNFPGLNSRGNEALSEKTFYNNNYVLSLKQISTSPFYIANYIKDQTFNDNYKQVIIIGIMAIFVGLVLSIFVAYFLTKEITKPINKLILSMKRVEDGNLAINIEENTIYEMQELNDSFNKMVIQIVKLLQTTKESQKRIFEAEREALQSQINPHFLFNTLNTIKALSKINNQEEIYTISIKLGQLLRSSIYNKSANCTLEKSLELVKSYLTIQKIRFEDKLDIEYEIDENLLNIETPKLIIQPLVENSIVHGLEPKIGKWYIKLKIYNEANYLYIEVIDNGLGFENKEFMKNINLFENTKHVGLYNVQKRLELAYHKKASLYFEDRKDGGTIANIKIPLKLIP